MTPTARAELRDYCKRSARLRAAQKPQPQANFTDFLVFIVLMVGLVYFIAYHHGESDKPAKWECPLILDGRSLVSHDIEVATGNHTHCRYEAPKPKAWKRG